jgi:hypothetical protein
VKASKPTPVRVVISTSGEYNHYQLQILTQRYPHSSDYYDILGEVTWQSNKDDENYWYGRTFKCETSHPLLLEMFAKIIKRLKDCYSPDEVHDELQSVRYKTHAGVWYLDVFEGCNVYQVLKLENGKHENWSSVVGFDYVDAYQRMYKRYKLNKNTAFEYVVSAEPFITNLP